MPFGGLTDRQRRKLQRQTDAELLGVEGLLEAYCLGNQTAFVQLANERGFFLEGPDGTGGSSKASEETL